MQYPVLNVVLKQVRETSKKLRWSCQWSSLLDHTGILLQAQCYIRGDPAAQKIQRSIYASLQYYGIHIIYDFSDKVSMGGGEVRIDCKALSLLLPCLCPLCSPCPSSKNWVCSDSLAKKASVLPCLEVLNTFQTHTSSCAKPIWNHPPEEWLLLLVFTGFPFTCNELTTVLGQFETKYSVIFSVACFVLK